MATIHGRGREMKLLDRINALEGKANTDLGQREAESICKELSEAEKQILVTEYVHSAYGELEGWNFSHLDADYSRVSQKIAGLKAAASNGL